MQTLTTLGIYLDILLLMANIVASGGRMRSYADMIMFVPPEKRNHTTEVKCRHHMLRGLALTAVLIALIITNSYFIAYDTASKPTTSAIQQIRHESSTPAW